MKNLNLLVIGILFLSRTAIASSFGEVNLNKCLPTQDCWPSEEEWEALNTELGGNLLRVRPLQAPCFDDPESTECQDTITRRTDARYRDDQPGAMMVP